MLQGEVLAKPENVNSSNCQLRVLCELTGNTMQSLQMARFCAAQNVGVGGEVTTKKGLTVILQYMEDSV